MSIIKNSSECLFSSLKYKVDSVFSQLDEYYYELKDRLIGMINKNLFEKDIEFFLIKMFKLDDKDDSEFNVISFIEQIKKLNDDLYNSHKKACYNSNNNDMIIKLQIKIDKLTEKLSSITEENDRYKKKLDQITLEHNKQQSKIE